MNKSLAAEAWNAVKDKDDPTFDAVNPTFREELNSRAADVVRTGLTINPFEEKVKELNAKAKSDGPLTPMGTTNALGEEPPKETAKVETKAEESATETESLPTKRAELDKIAVGLGLNPDDYANIAEITEAIEKKRK